MTSTNWTLVSSASSDRVPPVKSVPSRQSSEASLRKKYSRCYLGFVFVLAVEIPLFIVLFDAVANRGTHIMSRS